MKEYWIEIKGHPRYQVSTLGRVKCLNWNRTGKEKICKLTKSGNGYLQVRIDGMLKQVHRLVLSSFIPNPQNKPEVEHNDTNRANNIVGNLKWVRHNENCNNPLTRKHMSENAAMLGKFGDDCPNSVPIVQLTLDGKFIRRWSSAREVERELGFDHSNIAKCCIGKRNYSFGFRWVYASNYQKHISDINPLF